MTSKNHDDAVLAVNLEAAEEIARQLRLRDIGGIIIVDFIDMRNSENKKNLLKAMKQFMAKDRAQHTILALSKFGLMQITRQRVRPEVKINTTEVCPTCKGTRPRVKINLHAHPYVEAFLKKGFISKPMRWYMEHQKWIRIVPNNDFHLMEYKFFDDNEDEIRMQEGAAVAATDNHN